VFVILGPVLPSLGSMSRGIHLSADPVQDNGPPPTALGLGDKAVSAALGSSKPHSAPSPTRRPGPTGKAERHSKPSWRNGLT